MSAYPEQFEGWRPRRTARQRRLSRRELLAALDEARAEAAKAAAEHEWEIADLRLGLRVAGDVLAAEEARTSRLRVERHEAIKRARTAEATTRCLLEELGRQRAEHGEALAAAYAQSRPALPAATAPEPPELLPSGHWLFAGDPDVLHQLDDLDVLSLAGTELPVGTNGTGKSR